MGRPINSRYLGPIDPSGTYNKFTAIVKVGSNAVSETGVIMRQRSDNRFKVNDASDGNGNESVCLLVDKTTPSDDEMVIQGFVNGSGGPVNIRKLYNRTVIDFNGNRYDWDLQDDSSSANILVLFPL